MKNIHLIKLLNNYSIVILILTISIFFFSFTSNDQVAGMFSDDAMYLLQAELYSPWNSIDSPVHDLIRKESRFPPLYPILLGTLGVDTNNMAYAGLANCCILIMSFIAICLWLLKESLNHKITIFIMLFFTLLPGTLIMSQGLWSEFLFIFFIYAALLSHVSIKDVDKRLLVTSLLIALSTLTRSLGLAFSFGFIIFLIIKQSKKRLYYSLISIFPYLLWTLSRNILQNHPSYFDDLLIFPSEYSLVNVFELLIIRLNVLNDSWIWLFSAINVNNFYQTIINSLSLFLLALTFYGYIIRLKQIKLDTFCVTIYLVVIFIWPYQTVFYVSRFLYPLIPLFLYYMWIGINQLEYKRTVIAAPLWVISILLIIYPSTTQFLMRGYYHLENDLMPYRRSLNWLLPENNDEAITNIKFNKALIETLPVIAKHVRENECIYAYQAPVIMLYTKRISGIFPEYTTSKEEFEQTTMACNYFIAMNIVDQSKKYPPFYPLQHLNGDPEYHIQQFFTDENYQGNMDIYLISRINSLNTDN